VKHQRLAGEQALRFEFRAPKERIMAKRVLIVDDSQMVRTILSFTVETAGYDHECAASGSEALEMLASQAFDIALVDLNMPNMDGYSLIRKVRAELAMHAMPIIIITTAAEATDRERGFEAGADLYLVKPVDEQELVMNIKMLIGDPT